MSRSKAMKGLWLLGNWAWYKVMDCGRDGHSMVGEGVRPGQVGRIRPQRASLPHAGVWVFPPAVSTHWGVLVEEGHAHGLEDEGGCGPVGGRRCGRPEPAKAGNSLWIQLEEGW